LKRNNIVILIIIFSFLPEINYAQCAMCRAVLESGDQQETAEGINNGIIYLMAIPYVLVGALGYFIFKSLKKKSL